MPRQTLTNRVDKLYERCDSISDQINSYISGCEGKHDKVLNIATEALAKATTAEGRIDRHIHPIYSKIDELKQDVGILRDHFLGLSTKIDDNNRTIADLSKDRLVKENYENGMRAAYRNIAAVIGVSSTLLGLIFGLLKLLGLAD